VHNETPRDDFYNINGQANTNEGPNNGLLFTLNDEVFDHKKIKRRRLKENQEVNDVNKLY
jgi:hypothetical protein